MKTLTTSFSQFVYGRLVPAALIFPLATSVFAQNSAPDISTIPPVLVIPEVTAEVPAPGKRVFYRLAGDDAAVPSMVLYLPTDWTPEKRFPVIVEYAGNRN